MILLLALHIVLSLHIQLVCMDVVRVVTVVSCAGTVAVPFSRSWAWIGGLFFFIIPVESYSNVSCSCPIRRDRVVAFECGFEVVDVFLSCILHSKVVND